MTGLKKKKKIKSIASLKKTAQTLVNKSIILRDRINENEFVCISCQRRLPIKQYNVGHFFPIKGYGKLRYDLRNLNVECKKCNGFSEAHLIWYAIHLKEKLGDEEYANLLNDAVYLDRTEWTREELEAIIKKYGSKSTL